MEDAADLQGWELLHVPDLVIRSPAISAPASATGEETLPRAGGDSHDVIGLDYFGVNTENWYAYPSDGDRDDPDGLEPNPGSRFLEEPLGEGLGYTAAEFRGPGPRGLWSVDELSGVQEALLPDHAKGELDGSGGSQLELVLEDVNSVGGESEGRVASLEGTEETGVVEAGSDVSGDLESTGGDLNITVGLEALVERRNGDGGLQNLTVAKAEKVGMAWWKLPMEILKFCAFRIKPVWSISVAAALVGFLILGRRLYKKKPKSRNIPLKVCVDDKKVSQLMVRATRLNEAFSVVKQVPVIRSTLSAAGVTPWPVVALR
ncbi:hypothetical protein Taro_043288 [Colocasia esculenta]|uniref:DUF6821 domain-containing protein n=1 Tax=Colocasia esculenta TaxID=4460 RepID=A0A843X173_COLES|nr:hypothetical protein [Colocasia esculenta]